MAAPADIDFFNILFQAIKKFHEEHAPTILWVPISWKDHTYYIHKKPALRLLRSLIPDLRKEEFKDDNALIEYLYQKQLEGDPSLKRLVLPSDEKILTNQVVTDFNSMADQPPQIQEEKFDKLVEDHLGEKQEKERTTPTQRPPGIIDTGKSIAEGYVEQRALSGLAQVGRGLTRAGSSTASRLGSLTIRAGTRAVVALGAVSGGGMVAGIGVAFLIAFISILGIFMIPVLFPDFAKSINALGLPGESVAEAAPLPATPTPTVTPPANSSGIFSCPLTEGRVVYGSKQTNGHCSTNYGYYCVPPGEVGYTGRDTAVDVVGSDNRVFLPKLNGQKVNWTIDESGTYIKVGEGGGIALGAKASLNGHLYRIRFVHLITTNLSVNQTVPSDTYIGSYNDNANHAHITLQEDGNFKPADLYFHLCQ